MILTGGAGVLGKELRKELDFKLILDTDITELPEKNIYRSEASNLEDFCKMINLKPKVIFHLVNSNFDLNNFGKNITEFIKVLEFAKKSKAKVIYLSNKAVYCKFRIEGLDENPVSLKGEYYYTIDRIAKYYRKDIEIVSFRVLDYSLENTVKALKKAVKKGNGNYNLGNSTDMVNFKKDFGD